MVRFQIPLREMFLLIDKSYVRNIIIIDIEGVKRRTVKENATHVLFSVKARFGILIEGQTKGHQITRKGSARNEDEAEKKAEAILAGTEQPYLSSNRYVWFRYETILDVSLCYSLSPRAKIN